MEWVSIIPPLVAILIVFWKKEVIMALLMAVLCAEALILLTSPDGLLLLAPITSIERVVDVATSAGNTRSQHAKVRFDEYHNTGRHG